MRSLQLRLWDLEQADFVAMITDDTTDVSNHLQNVVVFRYIVSGKVVEKFSSFCDLPQDNAENLSNISETVLLWKGIVTFPMTSCDAGRCFSTLKRVKTFLRITMSEDRLIALAMISI